MGGVYERVVQARDRVHGRTVLQELRASVLTAAMDGSGGCADEAQEALEVWV